MSDLQSTERPPSRFSRFRIVIDGAEPEGSPSDIVHREAKCASVVRINRHSIWISVTNLLDGDGKLFAGMMNAKGGMHPSVNGYQVRADALKPVLTELLGPPAAADHAPPPTGDPSAGR